MQLGIFAKTFLRSTLEENLDAVRTHGFDCVQYNLVCAGVPTLPDEIDPALCKRICTAMVQRQIGMAAVSGTFNIIHPDRAYRETHFRRLRTLAEACSALGTSMITLCTGTRDPENMWRHHPDNDSPTSWREMAASVRKAVAIGEACGVTVGIEPEVNNVVDSAQKARRLLDEVGAECLKIIMDGANVFHEGELSRMHDVLDEAFELLGPDIALAHAKDLTRDGDAGHEAPGMGVLDYDHYLNRLHDAGFNGPLIAHGLDEGQALQCAAFLRDKLDHLAAGHGQPGTRGAK